MLISFLKKGVYGYLREDQVGIYGFFSNNNLSFRRSAVEAAGGYDDKIRIAEDYDICQRIARSGWLLYYCPNVSLDHGAHSTLRGLIKQWWSYGYHLAIGFKRHFPNRTIIAWKQPEWDDEASPEPLRGTAGLADQTKTTHRVAVYVYLSGFALLHLTLLVTLLAGLLRFGGIATAGCVLLVVLLCLYAKPDFSAVRTDGFIRAVQLFIIRYSVNFVFVLGGLVGGLSCSTLYVFPAIGIRVTQMIADGARTQANTNESDLQCR